MTDEDSKEITKIIIILSAGMLITMGWVALFGAETTVIVMGGAVAGLLYTLRRAH